MTTQFITLDEHAKTQNLLAAFRAAKAPQPVTASFTRPGGTTALTEQLAKAIESDIKAAREQTPEQIKAGVRQLLGMSPIGRAALNEAHTVGFSAQEIEAYSEHGLANFSKQAQAPGECSPEVRHLLEMSPAGRAALEQNTSRG